MTEKTTSPLKSALCEFKKLDIAILKQSTNPFFKTADGKGSKYADLATILDAVEAEAAKLGILIISKIVKDADGSRELYTKIMHKDSDEVEDSSFPIFGNKPQELGSSVTYARRYNIQSLLNLAAEDDDGNAANTAPAVKSTSGFPTAKARKDLFNAVMTDLDEVKSLDELQSTWISRTDDIAKLKASDMQIFHELEKRKDSLKQQFAKIDDLPDYLK